MSRLRSSVIDILHTAIGEDPAEGNLVLLQGWQDPIIQQIGRRDRCFPVIQLANPTLL